MKPIRAGIVIASIALVLLLTGCPNGPEDATKLTVGDRGITAVLEAGDEHWYSVDLEEGKSYYFVFKHDDNEAAVGAVYTVFLSEDGAPGELMWQHHYDPADFDQLTDESTVLSKQIVNPGFPFIAPEENNYLISIKGYEQDDGRSQRNTYAYDNRLVYTVAVKYWPSALMPPQGEELEVSNQAAGVPYTTNMIEVYEDVFHPFEMERNNWYQIQHRVGDPIGMRVVNQYGENIAPITNVVAAHESLYVLAPYDGMFFVEVWGPGGNFGFAEYGLRIQVDDHGRTANTATELTRDATQQGYLSQGDTDWFEVAIPRHALGEDANEYRVTISNSDIFELRSASAQFNQERDDGQDVVGSYIINSRVGDGSDTVRFSVHTTDDYDYLDREPDGPGAYQIQIGRR